ncbi:MAG: GntR family transcriptional regulator [Erysipelotrichaceae bacterium]|jgi:GntR family transcriptional regulator|nr:GntR family transcriptional regulator [Erysipelotrichaceae bacterium]
MINNTIDSESKTPIYYQLYMILQERIESGTYPEGSIFPSEAELVKEFGISRITVRRAISDLEHDGYIKTRKGSRATVLKIHKIKDTFAFESFSNETREKGEVPSNIIVAAELVEPSAKVLQLLDLQPGTKVYHLKRLRLRNNRISALHDTYINPGIGVVIDTQFDSDASLYEFYQQHGIQLGYADETIEAKLPDKALRQDLYMEKSEPILYRERITFDKQGRPIEVSFNSVIAGQYKYTVHMEKRG